MGEMVELSIPAIFPECGSCPLVRKVIAFWEEFASHTELPFYKTTAIRVLCFLEPEGDEEGCVLMMENAIQTCRHVPDGPFLQAHGGSLSPYRVKCPHFSPGRGKIAPL
mgnify:CR=1 FL=1